MNIEVDKVEYCLCTFKFVSFQDSHSILQYVHTTEKNKTIFDALSPLDLQTRGFHYFTFKSIIPF